MLFFETVDSRLQWILVGKGRLTARENGKGEAERVGFSVETAGVLPFREILVLLGKDRQMCAVCLFKLSSCA